MLEKGSLYDREKKKDRESSLAMFDCLPCAVPCGEGVCDQTIGGVEGVWPCEYYFQGTLSKINLNEKIHVLVIRAVVLCV